MTTATTIHGIKGAKAISAGEVEWLQLYMECGSHVSIFMPLYKAEAMAAAFEYATEDDDVEAA